jgi:hypothetical protein
LRPDIPLSGLYSREAVSLFALPRWSWAVVRGCVEVDEGRSCALRITRINRLLVA